MIKQPGQNLINIKIKTRVCVCVCDRGNIRYPFLNWKPTVSCFAEHFLILAAEIKKEISFEGKQSQGDPKVVFLESPELVFPKKNFSDK